MPAQLPIVYVVVVTYNGKRFLEPCFRTLIETDYANMRLLLVDNASEEDLAAYVRVLFPEVETLRLCKNVGYSGGANVGIDYALKHGADYVAVCNDDIEMVFPCWLDHAIRHMEADPRLGIADFRGYRTKEEIPQLDEVRLNETKYPYGFAMLFRASLLINLGRYDEGFGSGSSDDDDLAWRALQAGYRVVAFNIPFLHYDGGTDPHHHPRTGYLHMRNSLRFFIKQRTPFHWFLRIVRIVDVACNPWPLTFNPHDRGHRRWRNRGNLLLNTFSLLCAIGWNCLHLPQTLLIRARESRQIKRTRQLLETGAPASHVSNRKPCGSILPF